MNETQWRDFLHQLSRLLLDIDIKEAFDEPMFSAADHARGYVGFEGATEEQIAAVEERLGARLPNSYRNFLKVSNGWPLMGDAQPGALWPVEEIQWVRDHDPRDVLSWGLRSQLSTSQSDVSPEEHLKLSDDSVRYRMAYVDGLLGISDSGDASYLFLSPEVTDINSEWECWQFASWMPGATRYSSFEMWMLRTYKFLEEDLRESFD
jgi:hypothetical protein